MIQEDDWGLIWLEAWIECCDKSLANFLLAVEFGTKEDVDTFLAQFKRAKQCAVENLKDRRNDLLQRSTPQARQGQARLSAMEMSNLR